MAAALRPRRFSTPARGAGTRCDRLLRPLKRTAVVRIAPPSQQVSERLVCRRSRSASAQLIVVNRTKSLLALALARATLRASTAGAPAPAGAGGAVSYVEPISACISAKLSHRPKNQLATMLARKLSSKYNIDLHLQATIAIHRIEAFLHDALALSRPKYVAVRLVPRVV